MCSRLWEERRSLDPPPSLGTSPASPTHRYTVPMLQTDRFAGTCAGARRDSEHFTDSPEGRTSLTLAPAPLEHEACLSTNPATPGSVKEA